MCTLKSLCGGGSTIKDTYRETTVHAATGQKSTHCSKWVPLFGKHSLMSSQRHVVTDTLQHSHRIPSWLLLLQILHVCALIDMSEGCDWKKLLTSLSLLQQSVAIYSLDLHILLCLDTVYISICHPRVAALLVISHGMRIGRE